MKTPYEILFSIDRFFFAQYRINKLDCGYESSIRENKLTISTFSGNTITFEVINNELKISNLIDSFTIDRLDFWFKNEIREKHFWEFLNQQAIAIANLINITADFTNLIREPKSYATHRLCVLNARQIKRFRAIPSQDSYYTNLQGNHPYVFIGKFYAPSKNMARRINRLA